MTDAANIKSNNTHSQRSSAPSSGNSSSSQQHTQTALLGPLKIALLCGGTSSEREVSFASAANVEAALKSAGHTVYTLDTANPHCLKTLEDEQPDVAFIALHGRGGEDGSLQGALEIMGIPYTGSGVLGSALALDKHRSKIIYESLGFNTAPWICLEAHKKDDIIANSQSVLASIELPVVVKPIDDGSSVGIAIVKTQEGLAEALTNAFALGADVLVEKFIEGTEITVSVLGLNELKALPAIEIIPINEFYDYESKYAQGGSSHIIPARVADAVLDEASRIAIEAHRGLDCAGMSRTDMIVDANNDLWVIETNTIPGMTSTSLLPDAAASIGMSNQELYESLLVWALERAGRR